MMKLSKESLAVNLEYKLEQISRAQWEDHYLKEDHLVSWMDKNDYNHFDNMIENVKIATEEAGVSLKQLFSRLSQGLTVEQALSKCDEQQDRVANTPVIYDGVEYSDIRELFAKHNTSRNTVIMKMKKHKIPLKGALFLIDAENHERETLEQTSTPTGANENAIKARKASKWPEKFLSYLYFSQDDLVEISDALDISAVNLAVMKNSGYSIEWAVDKLVENRLALAEIPEHEFTRRIMADWDFDLAAQVFTPISINSQKFPTPVDALAHFSENFERAVISFKKGVNLFDIIGITNPMFIEDDNAYYTSVDEFSMAYGHEIGNVIALNKSGLSYNDIAHVDPKEIYRVGGMCFRDFEHACEYFQVRPETAKLELDRNGVSRFEVFTRIGRTNTTLLSSAAS